MTAIAGIQHTGSQEMVHAMLNQMTHRGNFWRHIVKNNNVILGASGSKTQKKSAAKLIDENIAQELINASHFARASAIDGTLELTRDALGISPLYYGRTGDGAVCFASEVKGLLAVTKDVHELPPGHRLKEGKISILTVKPNRSAWSGEKNDYIKALRHKLEKSILNRIGDGNVGSWLSGGIDSTAIAALIRPHVHELHSFVAGFAGSPDIQYAEIAARHIGTNHHKLEVTPEEILKTLPQVIYHLESFDPLLIRSTVLNFKVAQMTSDYVPAVFSGEGADELFGGYEYLQTIPEEKLQDELNDILGRLHNTALQRVDRSASAHGLIAYVSFLDEEVVALAKQIPAKYKIRHGVEKWVLRKAVEDLLPEKLLLRKKAKFWQGSGIKDHIANYADNTISDNDFRLEKHLPDGQRLNSKEELLYYRIFRNLFGEFEDLSWMGRTKKTRFDC
ncbi:MAG TPA: asparagine synthase-related protein [Anaerolineaceae bacterium]|nr:asparagine synthase-related protein [Anaerolineaceae bacterium]